MTSSTIVKCRRCGHKNRLPAAAAGVPRCGACHAPLPWIAEAGDDDFGEVVDQAALPVLVDFWAEWCGPCRMVGPILEELAGDLAGTFKLVKVNVDRAPKPAARFGVQAIPTLLIMNQGRLVSQRAGAAPAPVLRKWLEEALGSP
ncbi:thioredoxin [Sphaerisporangium fuscum]|uniref:thioredoxin n=1 Tax=Sphaerisporangium fuscum TaxID=2835868 RepID=UPI001BDC8A05|nr:thioredoxin [Sphaerisporangium fuscum]